MEHFVFRWNIFFFVGMILRPSWFDRLSLLCLHYRLQPWFFQILRMEHFHILTLFFKHKLINCVQSIYLDPMLIIDTIKSWPSRFLQSLIVLSLESLKACFDLRLMMIGSSSNFPVFIYKYILTPGIHFNTCVCFAIVQVYWSHSLLCNYYDV